MSHIEFTQATTKKAKGENQIFFLNGKIESILSEFNSQFLRFALIKYSNALCAKLDSI